MMPSVQKSKVKSQKWLVTLAVILVSATLLSAGDSDPARFAKLGHRLMCPCSCNQMLLECNHVGCPDSDKMRAQLASGISSGQPDDTILDAFIADYGMTVLAAPPKQGFDLIAWIAPFAALALGIALTIWFVRRWKVRHMQHAFAGPQVDTVEYDELRRRARQETEL